MTLQHVGYVGLGIMGNAMAGRLLDAGHRLTVTNRTRSKADDLKGRGATVLASPAEVAAAGPEVICINVTATPDVEAVLFGPEGILAGVDNAKPILIDHSTIDPIATRHFATRLAERGIILLDAPVSGGDVGARNGTLTVMVGGDAEAFQTCRPIFDIVGKTVTHLGPAGNGQVCKACNQVAVACSLVGAAEAIALAGRMGLDPLRMIEVVQAGAGGSWQLSNLGPKMVAGDYAPGFFVDYLLKDLAIVQAAAREAGLELPTASAAQARLDAAASRGHSRDGTQAVTATYDD